MRTITILHRHLSVPRGLAFARDYDRRAFAAGI